MHRLSRTSILITFGLLIICLISGCGDEDPPQQVVEPPQLKDNVGPPRATRVEVDPAPADGHTPTNTEFTLTFDQQVKEVTVNSIPARGSGTIWKTTLPLEVGPGQLLHIKWINQDGSMNSKDVGPYLILDVHGEPPVITGGSVIDGGLRLQMLIPRHLMQLGLRLPSMKTSPEVLS